MIIGLSGYARSGKDEAAKVLVEEFGYERVAFADKLREVLYALNPMVSQYVYIKGKDGSSVLWGGNEVVTVQDAIDTFGWDGYKETPYGPEIRRLLQRLGTEAGRDIMGENVWVDAALKDVDPEDKIVMTDCRFRNEARAIKDRGGWVVRVNRNGIAPANAHPSETSLDDWKFDAYLTNDGTLEEYQAHVRKFHDWIGEELYMRNVIGI